MLATSTIIKEESFYGTSFGTLQNVGPSNNSYFRLATGMEAIVPCDSGMSSDSCPDTVSPYLEITVQPSDRFRFRYRSESGSHGKLRGASKGRSKTNFPTVKLHNYDSRDKIEIRASLYTNEADPRPHILELVGKNCSGGTCSEMLLEDNTAMFRYLEIESKKKDELINILSQSKIDLYGEDCDEEEIKKEAINESKSLNMNAAKLCFEAFHQSIPICEKVFSDPIINLKSASSDLKITRLSLAAGRCSGGEEMILLCNKINKDDIAIRFYEKDENEAILWESFGDFNKMDVHHQVAIPFKTPPYHQNTEKTVYIELFRPSDKSSGEAVKFTYFPDEVDALRFTKKRKIAATESTVPFQDQPSISSQFPSSPSNVSSGIEDDIEEMLFPGDPGTSSNEHTFSQVNSDLPLDREIFSLYKDLSLQNFITEFNLVDLDNFGEQLNQFTTDSQAPKFETEYESIPSCEMDSAIAIQDEPNMRYQVVTETHTSSESSLLSLVGGAMSQMVGSIASYMQNSAATKMFDVSTNVARGTSGPSNDQFRKEPKCVVKGAVSNVDSADFLKRFSLPYSRDLKSRNNPEVSCKKSETSKNFELFKKGVGNILQNRKKDAFLHYVASLMSVADENGNLLLHLAVLEQSENTNLIAKILDISSQNVNKQNKFRQTCLHLATMKDSSKVVLLLMAYKGDPSIKNQDGNNCFHLAAQSNFVNSMKLLLLPTLKFGKHKPSLDDLNYDGLSPLHLSIMNNAKECLQLLLKAGANVNIAERKTGRSPLHLAIDQHPSLVGFLLCHPDINTDCTDFIGCTAYEAACQARGSASVRGELLKVAQLRKDNIGSAILSFLRTENMKSEKLASGLEADESSYSDTSSDFENEDDNNLSMTAIYHLNKDVEIKNQDVNYKQDNSNIFDEEKLCKILDVNSGWKKLGKFIGMDEKTLNGVEVLSKGSSPTKIILVKVKDLYGCDKTTLKNVLQMAELEETALMMESLNI